jgi:hypothetical protein
MRKAQYEKIKSMSLNPDYDLLVSKDHNRTNKKSVIPGGSTVVLVDHENKREMAYPNIKIVYFYTERLLANYDYDNNYCKNIDHVYYITEDNVIKNYLKLQTV